MNNKKTKVVFSLLSFLALIASCPTFAEQNSSSVESIPQEQLIINTTKTQENSPQGTTVNKSDQQGTSGVDAGAAANPVASANIVNAQEAANKTEKSKPESSKLKNVESNIKFTKKAAAIDASVKEIPFADNEQIRAALSNRDINRVFVTGDKIKTIHGPTGLYTAKNDPSDPFGSAYISIYSDTSFTIFLATVKGHNFSLLVTPKTMPGRTVILEPTTPSLLSNSQAETDSYQKTLVDLMNNMINLEPLEDYEYFSISEAKKQKWIKNIKKTSFYNIADVDPIAFYRGEKLSGIISKIRNKTKNPIALKPSYFYQSGVRAVALSQQIISPMDACWLYQIVGQD